MLKFCNTAPCSSTLPCQGRAGEGFLVGERVCTKLGGGMALAPVNLLDTVVKPLHTDYPELGDRLNEMLRRFANCAPNELTVELDFDPVLHGITSEMLSRNDYETEQYFYHPDHLGSSSFITDAHGEGYQHLQYLPFGETSVSQKLSSWTTPYQFSAKEKDEETGFSYFGARYYNSDVSVWLSVDPLSDKYPSMSAYMYCAGNPVMLVDPDGMKLEPPINWIPNIVDDELIYKFAAGFKSEKGNGVFHVFAHGCSSYMYGYNLKGEKILISTPEQLISLLCEVSPEFAEAMKTGKIVVIKLHSCNTGADEKENGKPLANPIAQQISEKYHNLIVVAPDGKVVTESGEDPDGPDQSDANVYEKGIFDKDGIGSYRWFYKGKEFKRDTSVSLPPNPDSTKSTEKSKKTSKKD